MIKLREYQKYSVDKYFEHIKNGKKHVCIAIPTGSGKTFVSAAIAKRYLDNRGTIIFIAPRVNLVSQTKKSFKHLGKVQTIQGSNKFDEAGNIYMASLATLIRRDLKINPSLVVIDESHYGYNSKGRKKIFEKFPCSDFLSLSATPFDPDGHELKCFDVIVKYKSIQWYINNGFLTPAECFSPTAPDLSKVKKKKGDYTDIEADKIMNNSTMIGDVVEKTKDLIIGKKCLFFGATISHAESIAAQYNSVGFRTRIYHSKLGTEERKEIIEDFSNGKIDILASVSSLVFGFDDPSVDCLIIARPTKSISFYRQLVGRGLRISPGKTSCLILDCAGVINSSNLPNKEVIPRQKTDFKTLKCKICETKSTPYLLSVKKINSIPNLVTTWRCANNHFFETFSEISAPACKNCSRVIDGSDFRETSTEYEVFFKCVCGEEKTIRTIKKSNYKLKKIENAGLAKIKEADLFNKLEEQPKKITKLKDLIVQKIHPDLQYSCLLALYENKELEYKELQKKLTDAIIDSALETNQFESLSSGMLKDAYNKTDDPVNIVCMHNQRAAHPMKPGWLAKTKKEINKAKKNIDNDILLQKTKVKCRDINSRGQKMASLFYFFENLNYGD